jgi:signal transduction histidine kinase
MNLVNNALKFTKDGNVTTKTKINHYKMEMQ